MAKESHVVPAEPLIIPWVAERITATKNPRHRKMLETLITHLRCEASGDLDGTMATMSAEPQFNTWGPKGDTGAKGYAAVGAMYADKFARGELTTLSTVYDVRRFVQDDHTIVFEFTGTHTMPWHIAKERGYAIGEERGDYAVRTNFVSILPFDDDCLLTGEISYGAGNPDPLDCHPVSDDTTATNDTA